LTTRRGRGEEGGVLSLIRLIPEWIAVLKEEGYLERKRDLPKQLIKMAWSLRGGVVSKAVRLERMRTCRKCLVFASDLNQCRLWLGPNEKLGCGCYVPFKVLAPNPYGLGCWGATFARTNIKGWNRSPGTWTRIQLWWQARKEVPYQTHGADSFAKLADVAKTNPPADIKEIFEKLYGIKKTGPLKGRRMGKTEALLAGTPLSEIPKMNPSYDIVDDDDECPGLSTRDYSEISRYANKAVALTPTALPDSSDAHADAVIEQLHKLKGKKK